MKIFVAFLFLISPFAISNIFGCLCDELPSIYPSFEQASVVFSGKALNLKEIKIDGSEIQKNEAVYEGYIKEKVYQFKVLENFKGVNEKDIEVNAGDVGTSCEVGFDVGQEYLVYGFERGGKLYREICSRTEPLKFAADQIYFIRQLLENKPEPLIYGSVIRRDIISHSLSQTIVNLAGIKIKIEEENGKVYQTKTDKNGIFAIEKLPIGEYEITSILPDFYNDSYSRTIFVRDDNKVGRKHEVVYNNGVFLEFEGGWNNNLSGTLNDEEGKLVTNARVRLLPISEPNAEIKHDIYTKILSNGKYYISSHSLGKYYLVAEVDYPTDKGDKYRQFYPQTKSPDGAFLINLKANEDLEYDIRLPFNSRKLEGKVLWDDNTKISKTTNVFLLKSNNDEKSNIIDKTYFNKDRENFSFDVFEGATYWVQAVVVVDVSKNGVLKLKKSKPIKVAINKTDKQIKILIPKPDKMDLAN